MTLSKKNLDELRAKNSDINIPDKDLRIDSFNSLVKKSFSDQAISIKDVKKYLRITDNEIAKMFGYKNTVSYRNSERKPQIENGIIELYKLVLRTK